MSSDEEPQGQSTTEQAKPDGQKPEAKTEIPNSIFKNAQQRIELVAIPVFDVAIKGIMSVSMGIAAGVVLVVTARCVGRVFGLMTAYGDLPSVGTIRREIREAFIAGMTEIKPVMPRNMLPGMKAFPAPGSPGSLIRKHQRQ
jgi:hypothetical protein